MKIEPKKMGVFQKFWLRLKFPKLPDDEGKYITIKTGEYNYMKQVIERIEKFLTQINQSNKRIKDLEEQLKLKEHQRRKIAGKVGGMQKELNKWKPEEEKKKQN